MNELNSETFELITNQDTAINSCIESISNWTLKYCDEPGMTNKVVKWVIPNHENEPGNNYINLKAHKPQKQYPGRLISTGCNSFTKNLAILTSYELKKVDLEFCLKDTNEFLRQIDAFSKSGKLTNSKSLLMCSFDIVSMFPSINKDLGLQACRGHLDKRENKIFSTECILDGIEITLDNNLTVFDDKMFRQIKGTAMGPANACDYADVSMTVLDELVHGNSLVSVHNIRKPDLFTRFRDDIFVLWLSTHDSLIQFFDFLNSFHPDIKFTMSEPTSEGMEFLDTYVYYKHGILQTKPFSKPCDNHQYLSPNSCTPTHTITNIPYNIAHRIFKISSEPIEYCKAKFEYSKYLKNRGYSNECINNAFEKAEKLDRLSLIYKDNTKTDDYSPLKPRNFPLVCDFNPDLPPIGKIVNKHKHILELDNQTARVINPRNVFVSYRGNRTIQDLLVPSKLKSKTAINQGLDFSESKDEYGCFKCKKMCKICKNFLHSPNHITSFHTDQQFSFRHSLSCEADYVIYLVDDLICKRSYVGSTTTSMAIRWRNHQSHIRNGVSSCEVAKHFKLDHKNHSFERKGDLNVFVENLKQDIRLTIIDKLTDDYSVKKLKDREAYWQNQLRTFDIYGGLNKRDSRHEKTSKTYSSDT